MHDLLTLDLARLGRTPAQAHAAATAILTPQTATAATSPMYDLCPAARPVAARLNLTPGQAVRAVVTVQDTQQPGLTAADLAALTGLPLATVQVVLDEVAA